MKLAVAGLNHRTAPVEVRERVAFRTGELPDALHRLHEQPGLREGLILSTCNRVEVTATLEDFTDPAPLLCHFLAAAHGLPTDSDLNEFIATPTRRASPRPSIATPGRRSGNTTSSAEVIAFTEVRMPRTSATPKK